MVSWLSREGWGARLGLRWPWPGHRARLLLASRPQQDGRVVQGSAGPGSRTANAHTPPRALSELAQHPFGRILWARASIEASPDVRRGKRDRFQWEDGKVAL